MKHKVFSVFDSKVVAFMTPFFAPTVGSASRSFSDAVQQEGSQFAKHAADFTLFQIGEWDDQTGVFLEFPAPVSMGTALEYVAKAEDTPKVVRRSGS